MVDRRFLIAMVAAAVLVAPAFSLFPAAAPTAQATVPPPVFWKNGDLVVYWGPEAEAAGLVTFLEQNTPRRAQSIRADVLARLDTAEQNPPTDELNASHNLTMDRVEWLRERFLDSARMEFSVKDAWLQSNKKSWTVSDQRTYKKNTLPLNPLYNAMHALYQVLGVSLDPNQNLELVSSISALSVADQATLANIVYATVDAIKQVEKARDPSTPSTKILQADLGRIISALDSLDISQNPIEPLTFTLDLPAGSAPRVEAAIANLSTYKTIRTAQAAIFMIQAIEESIDDLKNANLQSPSPSEFTACPGMTMSAHPAFVDPLCKVVIAANNHGQVIPFAADCLNRNADNQVPVVSIGGNGPDIWNCQVAAANESNPVSLHIDSGGYNVYNWEPWQSSGLNDGLQRMAYGAAAFGAAVFWDEGHCTQISAKFNTASLGSGEFGTGVARIGGTGSTCAIHPPSAVNIVSNGRSQGVGINGVGILVYEGTEPLSVQRYAYDTRCTQCGETFDEIFHGLKSGITSGVQGTGAAYFGTGLVLATKDDAGKREIRNTYMKSNDPAKPCPTYIGEGSYGETPSMTIDASSSSGLGYGYAGLGMVATAGTLPDLATNVRTQPCPYPVKVFAQGWGDVFGLGVVAGRLGRMNHEVGHEGTFGESSHWPHSPDTFVGLGSGHLGGVGAVVGAEGGYVRLCEKASTGDDPFVCDNLSSDPRHGAGNAGAFGIGLMTRKGDANNWYGCDTLQTRCFGGMNHVLANSLEPVSYGILRDSGFLFGVGMFSDNGGSDTYVGGSQDVVENRIAYTWEENMGPAGQSITGLFRDCAADTPCFVRTEGARQ